MHGSSLGSVEAYLILLWVLGILQILHSAGNSSIPSKGLHLQVTVGMVLIGAISIVRGILLFLIQIVAGIVAAYIVQALFQGKLAVSTTLGSGTTTAQGVVIEMILTAQLVFTIFMLAAEKHQGNFIAPVGIGLSLFIAELVGRSRSTLCVYKDHVTLPPLTSSTLRLHYITSNHL